MTAIRSHIRSYSRSYFASFLAAAGVLALLAILMLVNSAYGGEAYCDACKGEGWDPMAKLDEIGNTNAGSSEVMPGLSTAQKNRVGIWKQPLSGFNSTEAAEESGSSAESSTKSEGSEQQADSASAGNASGQKDRQIAPAKSSPEKETIVRSSAAKAMLAPIDEVSGNEILLDISENATSHIQGSIAIPYTEFMNGSAVRSMEELEEILGGAGISPEDDVIIYGECMPCGGGPAPATFVYWLMKSLGQENVRVMDGMVEDWQAAGKPISEEAAILPAKNYRAAVNSNFTADYDLVKGGSAQVVDARTTQEFGEGSIPGALNIPYEGVVTGNRIKDESRLKVAFSFLDKGQPVIVYTNTGVKASVSWFALTLLGYEARLYSYEDYWNHEQAMKNAGSANAAALEG